MNKLLTSHEQVPTDVIIWLETGKATIPGVGCMVQGVGCRFPTAVRIRLSQPPAGDWLAGAWAELGNKKKEIFFSSLLSEKKKKKNKT